MRSLPILPLILDRCRYDVIDIIAKATIWPNEKRSLHEFTDAELERSLSDFMRSMGTHLPSLSTARGPTTAAPPTGVLGSSVRVYQLEAPVGRESQKAAVLSLLRAQRGVVLYGAPGQGKTALARYVALEGADHYPEGVYEVDLQGERQIENLPRLIAAELGQPEVPSSYEVLARRRSLLILDSLDGILSSVDPEKLRRALDLLLDSLRYGSRVIITCQSRLEKDGLVPFAVPRLEEEHAELFHRLTQDWYRKEDGARVADFVRDNLDGHALSIKIVGRYSAPLRLSLRDLRRLWQQKWTDIAEFRPSLDDRALFTAFELTYSTLSPDEQVLFLLMSLVPDGMSTPFVKEIWPDEEIKIYAGLRTLRDRSLLDERGPMSDSARLLGPLFHFATEKRRQIEREPAERQGAELARLKDALDRFYDRYVMENAPQHTDADPRRKNELIRAEFHNIHASLDRRLEPSINPSTLAAATDVLLLYWACHNNVSGANNPISSTDDALHYLQKVHGIFVANSRKEEAIRCRYYIGNILWLRGEIDKAKTYLCEVAGEARDNILRCDCQRAFAHIEYKEGSLRRAVALYTDVITEAERIGYIDCMRRCCVGVLDAYRKTGEFEKGIAVFRVLAEDLPNCHPSIRGNAIRGYAYLLASQGEDLAGAKAYYKSALEVFAGVSPFGQAHCRRGLGDVYVRTGHLEEAAAEFDRAIKLYDEAQKNPSLGVGLVVLGRGRLLFAQHDVSGAIERFREAAVLFDRQILNEPYELAIAHERLGEAYFQIARLEEARANFQIAVNYFDRVGADRVSRRISRRLSTIIAVMDRAESQQYEGR